MCKYCNENPEPILDDRYLRVIIRKTSQDMKIVMQIREKKKEIEIEINSCPKCGVGLTEKIIDEPQIIEERERIFASFYQHIL